MAVRDLWQQKTCILIVDIADKIEDIHFKYII